MLGKVIICLMNLFWKMIMPINRAGSEVLLFTELLDCRCKLSMKEHLLSVPAFWNAFVYMVLPDRLVTYLGVTSTQPQWQEELQLPKGKELGLVAGLKRMLTWCAVHSLLGEVRNCVYWKRGWIISHQIWNSTIWELYSTTEKVQLNKQLYWNNCFHQSFWEWTVKLNIEERISVEKSSLQHYFFFLKWKKWHCI